MKNLTTLTLSALIAVTGTIFASTPISTPIPSGLTAAMAANKGKISIFHTGREKTTIEGQEQVAEDELKITGPGKLFGTSTKTINVPNSGKPQLATFKLKADGTNLVFVANKLKKKTGINTKKATLFDIDKTVPVQQVFNTSALPTLLTGRSDLPNMDFSTLGIAYFKTATQNYVEIYDANGISLRNLDMERGTPLVAQ